MNRGRSEESVVHRAHVPALPAPARSLLALAALLVASCAGSSTGGAIHDGAVSSVSIDPTTWSLAPAATKQFTATVLPQTAVNTTVSWSIQEGSAGGTVASGLYTAPASVSATTTYHVVVTANADTSKTAIASVTVSPSGTVTNLEKLQRIATKTGLFGHKSTGQNLIDGNGDGHAMQTVVTATQFTGWTVGGDRGWSGRNTDLASLYSASTPNGYRLLNLLIGNNGDALSKTAAFDSLLNAGGFGAKLNAQSGYALMKWCFGDFSSSTNVQNVFNDYKSKLHAWKAAFPNVKFLHMTVPVIGPAMDGNNPYREAFSDLLRNDSEIVNDGLFDLADLESVCNGTFCDAGVTAGQHDSKSYDGNHVRMLRSEYGEGDPHPRQPAEEDWLGQKLIDFLYAHL
jgi:hypothetical protein